MLRYDFSTADSSATAHPDTADQRAGFAQRCALVIPRMVIGGYSWRGFLDFSPNAITWLRCNQHIVRDGKSYFDGRRLSRQKADATWARLAR